MYDVGKYYEVKIYYKPKGNGSKEFQSFTTNLFYHELYIYNYFDPKFIKFFRGEDGLEYSLHDYDYYYELGDMIERTNCTLIYQKDGSFEVDYPVLTKKELVEDNMYHNLPFLKKIFKSNKLK